MINVIKESLKPFWMLLKKIRNGSFSFREVAYSRQLYFSQFGEDIFLENYFGKNKKNGFYIDVGAYHPLLLSNTYIFHKKGWRGINIEPNPKHFSEFNKQRKNDINLNIGVSHHSGHADFICNDVYSGIPDCTYISKNKQGSQKTISIETEPLHQILERHVPSGVEIDFLSIDCEGHDLTILKSNDWNRFRPRLICIEDHSSSRDTPIQEFMQIIDYRETALLGYTRIFETHTDIDSQKSTQREI